MGKGGSSGTTQNRSGFSNGQVQRMVAGGGGLGASEFSTEGMRPSSLALAKQAFAGASPAQATAIATGQRAVLAGGSGRLPAVKVNIEVYPDGSRRIFLQDGRHRSAAAREAGATHIRAQVRITKVGKRGGYRDSKVREMLLKL